MSQNQKKKILIVDDDPGILRLLEKTLPKAHGYEVFTALESRKGFELAKTHQPDLILLDIMIPDQSGGDLARDLKNDPRTQHIPIVFMSVLLEEEGKKRIEIHGQEYRAVAKPIYFPELLSAIRKAINESQSKGGEHS